MRVLSLLKAVLLPAGLIVIGVLAVVVMYSATPERPAADLRPVSSVNWFPMSQLDLLQTAQADFRANEANASSAPQQQVVAGWATKDLLGVIALQNAAAMNGTLALNGNVIELQRLQSNITAAIEASVPPVDDRPRHLLTLAVLALCWLGIWSVIPAGNRRKRPAAPDAATGASDTAQSAEVALLPPTLMPPSPESHGSLETPGS